MPKLPRVAVQRMDNMGIVVEDLTMAIKFFCALGLELEGRAMVEGEWAGRVTGLGDQRVEIAMMRTPTATAVSSSHGFSSPRSSPITGPLPSTRWGTCASCSPSTIWTELSFDSRSAVQSW
jgi:hypothetical protein